MKTRIISSVVAVALLIGILMIQENVWPMAWGVAVILLAGIGAWEAAKAAGLGKFPGLMAVCVAFGGFVPLVQLLPERIRLTAFLCGAMVFGLLLFLGGIVAFGRLEFASIACAGWMVLIESVGLSVLSISYGSVLFYLIIVGSWTSDIGAYFVGRACGKHKLTPVSPKKTVEGFVGGLASCTLCLCLTAWIFLQFFLPEGSRVLWGALIPVGIVTSCVSVVGDLSFSMMKRHFGVKDYGKIMPGHGGVLDRFDSVIFVAPFLYMMFRLWPIVG